jgi:quinol monooxygenase YgiN
MIHTAVTIIAPLGQRDGILRALRSLVCPTRVEPGCLRCRLYEDVEDAGAFTLVEEWSTGEAFERRLRSEPYRQLLLLMELSAGPPEVRFYPVFDVMGIEAVHAAREGGGVVPLCRSDETVGPP